MLTSSRTSQLTFFSERVSVKRMWSINLPGVAIKMLIPFRSRAFSDFFFSPPLRTPGTILKQIFERFSHKPSTSTPGVHLPHDGFAFLLSISLHPLGASTLGIPSIGHENHFSRACTSKRVCVQLLHLQPWAIGTHWRSSLSWVTYSWLFSLCVSIMCYIF